MAKWDWPVHKPEPDTNYYNNTSAPAEVEGLVERTAAGETVNGIKVTAYVEDKETPLGDVPAYSGHWSTPGKSARNVRRLFAEEDVMPALTALQAENERLREAADASDGNDIWRFWNGRAKALMEKAHALQARAEKAEAERDAWKENAEALDATLGAFMGNESIALSAHAKLKEEA